VKYKVLQRKFSGKFSLLWSRKNVFREVENIYGVSN
jgi:hypothetical protein